LIAAVSVGRADVGAAVSHQCRLDKTEMPAMRAFCHFVRDECAQRLPAIIRLTPPPHLA
jgi:hypothetical protein